MADRCDECMTRLDGVTPHADDCSSMNREIREESESLQAQLAEANEKIEKLKFAVKVYKQREKDTGASYEKDFERLSEERDNSADKERIRVLGLIEDFGCACSRIVSQSEGVVHVHEERCPFMMAQKIRKLSDD